MPKLSSIALLVWCLATRDDSPGDRDFKTVADAIGFTWRLAMDNRGTGEGSLPGDVRRLPPLGSLEPSSA